MLGLILSQESLKMAFVQDIQLKEKLHEPTKSGFTTKCYLNRTTMGLFVRTKGVVWNITNVV